MKIALVSSFYDLPNEIHLLNLLFCNGLETYHLRKDLDCTHLAGTETYTEERIRNYIESIPEVFRNRIIIHSHFHLVKEYGLKGAHFTNRLITLEEYLKTEKLTPDNHGLNYVGFSIHSTEEIAQYSETYDYLFLSPIFDSISNVGYNSKFDLSRLKKFIQETPQTNEIIALGGMNDTKVAKVKELGFSGLSLLGYIWSKFEDDQDILSALARYKKIIEIKNSLS